MNRSPEGDTINTFWLNHANKKDQLNSPLSRSDSIKTLFITDTMTALQLFILNVKLFLCLKNKSYLIKN